MWKSGLGWQPQLREEAEERGKGQDRDGSGAVRIVYVFTVDRVLESQSSDLLHNATRLRHGPWRTCLSLHQSLSLSLHLHRSFVRSRPSGCTCPSPSPSGTARALCEVLSRVVRPYVRPPPESGVRTGEWRVATVTDTDTDRINGVRAPTGRRALYA